MGLYLSICLCLRLGLDITVDMNAIYVQFCVFYLGPPFCIAAMLPDIAVIFIDCSIRYSRVVC